MFKCSIFFSPIVLGQQLIKIVVISCLSGASKSLGWHVHRAKHSLDILLFLLQTNPKLKCILLTYEGLRFATKAARDHDFLDPTWRRRSSSAGSHMHCNSTLSWSWTRFDIIATTWRDFIFIDFLCSVFEDCFTVDYLELWYFRDGGSADLAVHDAGHRQEGVAGALLHQGLHLLPLQESRGA